MFIALVTLHVIVSLFLIGVVLLQSGKAGNIADVFGGGGSMAAFGARGAATVLSRVTTVAAIIFMITSLGLSIVRSHGGSSVMQDTNPVKQEIPKTPSTPPKK